MTNAQFQILQNDVTQKCKNSSREQWEWLDSNDFTSFLKSLKLSNFSILTGTLLLFVI